MKVYAAKAIVAGSSLGSKGSSPRYASLCQALTDFFNLNSILCESATDNATSENCVFPSLQGFSLLSPDPGRLFPCLWLCLNYDWMASSKTSSAAGSCTIGSPVIKRVKTSTTGRTTRTCASCDAKCLLIKYALSSESCNTFSDIHDWHSMYLVKVS